MCDHSYDPGGREAAMVVVEPGTETRKGVWCDPCLAPLIRALNAGEIRTVASCCGHGHCPGNVLLADGRILFVATAEQWDLIYAAFPLDNNGDEIAKRPYEAVAKALAGHRICNASHGRVACYCSAYTWMTLDEYGEHIEGLAAILSEEAGE